MEINRLFFKYAQIVATQVARFASSSTKNQSNVSTVPSAFFDVVRRQMRHVPDVCEKFTVGDETKQEFYSPNYPDNYPNLTDCIKVLKGEYVLWSSLKREDKFQGILWFY